MVQYKTYTITDLSSFINDFKMNRSIFAILFGISVGALIKTVDIPEKLYIYQNLTGISDEKVYEIYQKAMTNTYATAYPKFRYHLSSGPHGGTVAPIIWDVQKGQHQRLPRKKSRYVAHKV